MAEEPKPNFDFARCDSRLTIHDSRSKIDDDDFVRVCAFALIAQSYLTRDACSVRAHTTERFACHKEQRLQHVTAKNAGRGPTPVVLIKEHD